MTTDLRFLTDHVTEQEAREIITSFQVRHKWPDFNNGWNLMLLVADAFEQGCQQGYIERMEGN